MAVQTHRYLLSHGHYLSLVKTGSRWRDVSLPVMVNMFLLQIPRDLYCNSSIRSYQRPHSASPFTRKTPAPSKVLDNIAQLAGKLKP